MKTAATTPPPLRTALPPRDELVRAYLASDTSYEGVFITAVKTTGIFCRPACRARKPKPENVEFFRTTREALFAGYRPCKRCRPLEEPGQRPEWLAPLIEAVEADPARRWRSSDLRQLGLDPARVARWFKAHHAMTFQAYSRSRRLGAALGHIQHGASVSSAALDVGYDSLSAFNDAFRQLAGGSPMQLQDAEVVYVDRIETPLGTVVTGATNDHLVLLEFADRPMLPTQFERIAKRLKSICVPGTSPVLDALRAQLADYFAGVRRDFDIPLRAPGTEFQMKVWDELRRIPAGVTRSYGDIARAIGQPTAVRAVARANGDNRIAILIPCHRVIGSDGTLTGYGGGLWRKQRLLDLEAGVTGLL
jgi:AraC family transcriptional regulator of adaptative response/methylated-DNA-[protein]-cysteine methyltransferase